MATATLAKTKSPNGHARLPLVSRASRPRAQHPVRWTFEQYQKLVAQGWFEGRRVELIRGEIIEMTSMLHPHWFAGEKSEDAIRAAFGFGFRVVVQKPLHLPIDSAPEPDIAVIAGALQDFQTDFPTTAVLVLEISSTTLHYDRTTKAALYAAAGIAEYWVLNLKDRKLEVMRSPVKLARPRLGFDYDKKIVLSERQSIAPLAAPGYKIKVADLLP